MYRQWPLANNLLYDNDVFQQSEEDKDDADAHPNVEGGHITHTGCVLPEHFLHIFSLGQKRVKHIFSLGQKKGKKTYFL